MYKTGTPVYSLSEHEFILVQTLIPNVFVKGRGFPRETGRQLPI